MRDGRGNQAYGLSLLFPKAARPDVSVIRSLAENAGGFSISHDPAWPNGPAREEETPTGVNLQWLELLANGLTFDLSGLSTGVAAPRPTCAYRFDLPQDFDCAGLEALSLYPGPHLAGGERIGPVIRAIVGLAAQLCQLDSLVAVAWHPARSCIGPRYFMSIVDNWLEGGVFPGLGLVGLDVVADGGMQSEGVAFFTGQELRIEPELTDDRAAAAKIAVRLIDFLVESGPLETTQEVVGPEGRILRIEPSTNKRFVRVWSAG